MSHSTNQSSRSPRPLRDVALRVVRTLQDAGFTTYWAGGCVRDMLLKRVPNDYDIATSATPQDVAALFKRTRQVGAQFGVMLVRSAGHDIEVATFRTDGAYTDGRRPTEVTFSTPQEDAQRRDFTINGMFYDPVADVTHDYVDGEADLRNGLIRAIGVADERFEEDHLRVLRAIKFAARFGFQFESTTWKAMQQAASKLPRISPERIRMELEAIFSGPHCDQGVQWLADSHALDFLWNNSDQLRNHWQQRMNVLVALATEPQSFEIIMAALLHIEAPAHATNVCAALRCSNQTTKRIEWLIANQHVLDDPDTLTLADLKFLMAHDGFEALTTFCAAIHRSRKEGSRRIETVRARAAAIPSDEVAPPPLITGDDLIAAGLRPGPAFKQALESTYYRQLLLEISTKEDALAEARRLLEKRD